jgi:hypothetical protein
MVTLLGFVWIVANVFLTVFFMPDLLGPVCMNGTAACNRSLNCCIGPFVAILQFRPRHVDVSIGHIKRLMSTDT